MGDFDRVRQSGVHYDTRTTQMGDGTRYGGVVDGIFAVDNYVHLVWASTAKQDHTFFKNGQAVANRPAPPIAWTCTTSMSSAASRTRTAADSSMALSTRCRSTTTSSETPTSLRRSVARYAHSGTVCGISNFK